MVVVQAQATDHGGDESVIERPTRLLAGPLQLLEGE